MTTVCFWARAGPAARPAASTRAEVRPTARSMRRIIGASLDLLASDGGAPAPATSCGSPCLTWDSFEPSRPASLRHEAAVHDHLRAGHERGFVRGQEERGVGDLARLADAPQRDRRLELRPQ